MDLSASALMDYVPARDTFAPGGSARTYRVYGVHLRSEIILSLIEAVASAAPDVELVIGSPEFFAAALEGASLVDLDNGWYSIAYLPDGSTYVRWEDLFHFLVSADGHRVVCGDLGPAAAESFHTYLLGHALSFALIKKGFEPLHATCVSVNGQAVAFLGQSGYGKSSLAASFLAAGHRMVTDDLLICRPSPEGLMVQPGPHRIKLLPKDADRFLGAGWSGTPMNPSVEKLVIPLGPERTCDAPVPLRRIYVLDYPDEDSTPETVQLVHLSQQQAFVELLRGTFNIRILGAERLHRQFAAATDIVRRAAVGRLVYPRVLADLPKVRDRILADLEEERS
jgi:hypothetical protein